MTALATPSAVADLIGRARTLIGDAQTMGEVRAGQAVLDTAYDLAKRLARFATSDDAKAEAHSLSAQAMMAMRESQHRLADEVDAAQARGELARQGQRNDFLPEGEKVPTAPEAGISHKELHAARKARDFDRENPGTYDAAVQSALADGKPTKAEVARRAGAFADELSQARSAPLSAGLKRAPGHKTIRDPEADAHTQFAGACRAISSAYGELFAGADHKAKAHHISDAQLALSNIQLYLERVTRHDAEAA